MSLRQSLLAVLLTVTSVAAACNIPVFRYALERWKSDSYKVVVFHDSPLNDKQKSFIKKLNQSATDSGGNANIEIVQHSVGADSGSDAKLSDLWQTFQSDSNAKLPYLVVRTRLPSGEVNAWHGSLEKASQSYLIDSPARQAIAKRLLRGDSVVWVMLKSTDKAKNEQTRKLVESANKDMASKVTLPDGIGLPGSELFSDVPLLLQFSLLEIEAGDPKEQFLINLFTGIQPEAYKEGEPLVVPIFGRGRALEVIPGSDLKETLIHDLTIFLSGPCSCQVKDRNPGFDILLSADWDSELFGEDGEKPPAKSVTDPTSTPKLLNIPPGRKR